MTGWQITDDKQTYAIYKFDFLTEINILYGWKKAEKEGKLHYSSEYLLWNKNACMASHVQERWDTYDYTWEIEWTHAHCNFTIKATCALSIWTFKNNYFIQMWVSDCKLHVHVDCKQDVIGQIARSKRCLSMLYCWLVRAVPKNL